MKISYYNIGQGKIKEDDRERLALAINRTNNSTTDINFGIDLSKELKIGSLKMKNLFSIEVIRTIAHKSNPVTANVVGAKGIGMKFEFEDVPISELTGRLTLHTMIKMSQYL